MEPARYRQSTGTKVELKNSITGYDRTTGTDAKGAFQFQNVPPSPYRVTVSATGFSVASQDVTVRSVAPISVTVSLALAGAHQSVTVESSGPALLENVPYAHNDVDQELYQKLPTLSPASGLSDAITLASPGVVADSNGFFHPLGDHAQTDAFGGRSRRAGRKPDLRFQHHLHAIALLAGNAEI